MTEQERELWRAVAELAEQFGQLPELHPTAPHETAHAIARLQDMLLARPGLRAQGWGGPPQGAPDRDESAARLARFGLTDAEIELWFAMAAVAGALLALPEIQNADAERHEVVHAAHRLQDLILARPGNRMLG